MRPFIVILLILATSGTLGYLWLKRPGPPSGPDVTEAVDSHPSEGRTDICGEGLVSRLTAAGWPEDAAKAVIDLNLDRYELLHREVESVLERELKALEELRLEGRLAALLESHPELAGVVLMIRNSDELADGILDCGSAEDADRLIGSFVKYTDAGDMEVWAAAVKRHGKCISGLLRRCAAWPVDGLFSRPPGIKEVPEQYDRWLDDVFSPLALPDTDEETLSLLEFALASGPGIRKMMAENPAFRQQFNDTIWPAFARCVRGYPGKPGQRVPWEWFAAMPELWQLLMRPDGEALFQRCGLLPVELFYGKEPVPDGLREKCAQLLLGGDLELVETGFLGRWKDWPEFQRLVLHRNLNDGQILTCCKRLVDAGDFSKVLLGWNGMSDAALAEDIGPPPNAMAAAIPGFAVYHAARKLVQGRGLDWTDAAGLAGDAITLATLGTSAVLVESVKGGGKTLVTKTLTETGKTAARKALGREAVDEIAVMAGREIANEAAKRELVPFIVHHALKSLPETIGRQLLKSSMIDITDITRAGFTMANKMGLGRASVKRFTGLEARVFMRGDGRVIVNLPVTLAGRSPSARFLNETALNLAFDQAGRAAAPAAPAVVEMAKSAKERVSQNIACWWAGLATGSFSK